MEKESSRYSVPNLERALVIMELLARYPKGLNMTGIIEKIGLPQNAVFRITHTLTNHGYLHRDEDSKVFTLTKKMLSLGQSAVSDGHIIENSLPLMRQLRDEVNATAYLGTLLDTDGVILEQAPGGYPFKFCVDLGTRFQLHCGAAGKALIAFLPEAEQKALISRLKLTKYNERTITGKRELKKELEQVRQLGYAVDRAEQFEAVHCIGAPILDANSYPVAIVWISAPSVNLPEEKFSELGPKVAACALQISTRLGYALVPENPEDQQVMK
ncbi:MAG: IclR family transcriptional regulator [Holophagae bacterium]|nr:IclR family transcriptional regulator [Holophagae bacterium]